MRTTRGVLAGLLAALLAAGPAAADVFVLTNGDRVTGKRVRGPGRAIIVDTEFGRLTIPRARVSRIVKSDGTEEVITTAPVVSAAGSTSTARLTLIILGKSFWLAWDPKRNPGIDPSLRLEVRLDGKAVSSYADTKPDPKDLPGATVNTFSFLDGDFEMEGAPGILLSPPEVRPGRASLRIEVPFPSDAPSTRTLGVAYQFNAGTADEPEWRDVVTAETALELARSAPTFILMRQDPGRMGFSGVFQKRMRNIETFRVELAPGS
ncbi:MAG TPA: hypothetical protein VFO85_13990 [Vicinamibacteria bacterium]|nr:hypothetical protein [Vicinamibacteria bacterium]